MNEFQQKIAIAVVSSFLGGGVGFGADLLLQDREEAAAIREFARDSQYEFLSEMYTERKDAYLSVEAARRRAFEDPTPENLDALISEFYLIPIIQPRLPTNMMILGFGEEVSEKIRSLSGADEVRDFLRLGMVKYACIFDVNLQTIEELMRRVSTEAQVSDLNSKIAEGDLALLDNACYQLPLGRTS